MLDNENEDLKNFRLYRHDESKLDAKIEAFMNSDSQNNQNQNKNK